MNGLLPLISLIVSEIALIFVGVALVPILNETSHKKSIKYVFPSLILVGVAILIIYITYLYK